MSENNETYTVTVSDDTGIKVGDLVTIEGLNHGKPFLVSDIVDRVTMLVRQYTFWDQVVGVLWRRPIFSWRYSDWMPEIYYEEKEINDYYQTMVSALFE